MQLLRRIPPKWALAIVGVVLAYWLGQPILNRTFGWNLPTIAAMLGEDRSHSKSEPTDKPSNHDSKARDFLTEVGPDHYRSPAGLFYTRGSEEGHRLKHLATHLEDQPTWPGPHGVFDGDLDQVLRWVDEAYQKAKNGDRSARTIDDDESTKYEVTFDEPIGYVGGSEGKRKGNPSTKRLRLIVIGQNVITAFPF